MASIRATIFDLGDAPKFNPVHHGFDEFFGVPYSNDMEPYYYLRGTERFPESVDRDSQIRRYTEEAQSFIRKRSDGVGKESEFGVRIPLVSGEDEPIEDRETF